MNRGMEHDLIRLLHGELAEGEARELRARMLREPDLAAAFRRLERTWNGLEPPPPAPVPSGFAGRVLARARAEGPPGSPFSWSAAPGWVRAAAAAALIAGAALGAGVGRSWPDAEPEEELQADFSIAEENEYSLTGGYWELVDETTGEEELQ